MGVARGKVRERCGVERGEGRGAAGRWRGLSVRAWAGGAWGEARGVARDKAVGEGKGAGEGSRPHRGGVGLSVRGKEAFLVIAAAVGVDEGYETAELGVVRGEGEQALQQGLETLNLVLVAFGGAFLQKFLYPVGDEEFRSAAGVGSSVDRYPEFREEDADSGEVEVAEMQIAVRDALQPSH